jgi:hypothetical protein
LAKKGTALIEVFHVRECDVYEYFASGKCQNNANVSIFHPDPPVSMPKYYYFNRDVSKKEPLVIVLEDLSQFTIVDLIDGFNNTKVCQVIF